MKTSKTLLLSVFITAVILVVAGSVVSARLSNNQAAAREEQYRQLIEQANQQITQANQDIVSLQEKLSQTQPQPGGSPAEPQAAVSAEQAAEVARAQAEAGQDMQKAPELVSFEGKAAYEVLFANGSIYVDANSGQVLFNGTVPQKITANQAARVAAEYLHEPAVLTVDQILFRSQPLYRVIFKSGTMVYLDEFGQITYINKGMQTASVQLAAGDDDDGGGGSGGSHHDDDHDDD